MYFFHTSSLCVKYIATAIYLQEIFESVYSLQEIRKNIYDIVFLGDNDFYICPVYFVCNAQIELTFFVRKNKIKALILHFIDCILTGCYDLCVKNK